MITLRGELGASSEGVSQGGRRGREVTVGDGSERGDSVGVVVRGW